MVEIRKSENYVKWFDGLRDIQAQQRIEMRINRLLLGHSGDAKPVGQGLSELRINYGPGYRVYYTQRGKTLVILLAGGDKSTQSKDIRAALDLARAMKEMDRHEP